MNTDRLATFERLATDAIRRVNAMEVAASVQARRDLKGWQLRWATALRHKHGYAAADIRAAWDRAIVAARQVQP